MFLDGSIKLSSFGLLAWPDGSEVPVEVTDYIEVVLLIGDAWQIGLVHGAFFCGQLIVTGTYGRQLADYWLRQCL